MFLAISTVHAKHKEEIEETSSSPVVQPLPPRVGFAVMQSTGKQPDVYHYFADFNESLPVAMHYLPDHPVIVDVGAYDGRESCALASVWPKYVSTVLNR